MPKECCGQVVLLLNGTTQGLPSRKDQINRSLLSPEGKVLSAIIRENNVIMKDIPLITGISFRSCYEIIGKLCALGIIEKKTHSSDRRASTLNVDRVKLCENFCHVRLSSNARCQII